MRTSREAVRSPFARSLTKSLMEPVKGRSALLTCQFGSGIAYEAFRLAESEAILPYPNVG